jgi:deoxyribodipyrimidine photolyase
MVAVKVSVKHLLINWWGNLFAEKLLDYEMASNVGNGNGRLVLGLRCSLFQSFQPGDSTEKI